MSFFDRFKRKPKAAKAATEKKPSRLWKVLKVLMLLGVSLVVVGLLAFTLFAAWVSRDLPDPNVLSTREVAQSTKLYDKTGTVLLYEIHGDEKRTLLKIEEIPDYAKHATIAIEDRQFYEHHGIYWRGLVRAVVVNTLKGERIKGTSTLTQQLVKNAILSNERSGMRKVKEFILSLQIERQYSKDQILQLYLNEIPYGSNLYGLEAASESYFGKNAKDLTLDEAALIASIPAGPDLYDPYGRGTRGDNRPRLVVRQHYVMDQMADQGYVTKEQVEEAKKVDTLAKLKPRKIGDILAPHFVIYVKDQLIKTYGVKTVEQGGLKVITSLDWAKQEMAQEEVKKGVDANGKKYKFTNGALISLDPKTGQVVAMVGSKDFFDEDIDGQYNVITDGARQPGSSFKPLVYAAGFMKGYLPETELWDVNTNFKVDGVNFEPKNYNFKENGPVSIRKALQGSLNIPAVAMQYLVGVGRTIDFAESLGYTTFKQRNRFGLALVLGSGEVYPIEHAAAYATFANDGMKMPTVSILKVEDANGIVLEEWKQPAGERVVDAQVVRTLSDVLSDNTARAYTFGARNSLTLPDRPVAGKTGTTNDNKDAWMAGYTPNLVTVVWVGNSNGDEMAKGADGSYIAAPIWQAFMTRALKGMPVEKFAKPEAPATTKPALLGKVTLQKVRIDKISGKLATDQTPPEFVEERELAVPHSILYWIDKDDPMGPPPQNPASDPMFPIWESAVLSWVQRSGWMATSTAPTTYDDVHTAANNPVVAILNPSPNQTYTDRGYAIQPQITALRRIVRVEASIGGQPLASTLAEPWVMTGRFPANFERGLYEITVTAVDDVGNRGSAKIAINLQADVDIAARSGDLSIYSPFNDVVWSRAGFPEQLVIGINDPTLFRRIEASFIGEDGQKRTIHVDESITEQTEQITIPAGPPPGRYRLMVQGLRTDGNVEETSVNVTVTD